MSTNILNKTQKLQSKNFLNYINTFRGLAILLIIMGHTMQFGETGSLTRVINCEIVCGGTALFVFISGFLFQHLSNKFEYKNYLSKKWSNVILPYLFTSIPGLAFCFLLPVEYKNSFDGLNWLLQIPIHLSIGRVHNVPAWFIPMILIFFLFSFVFLKLEKRGWLYRLLPLFFFVTIFLQRGVMEYENTIGLDFFEKYLLYIKYILKGFLHFLSLYTFGMFCSSKKEIIDVFWQKRKLLFALMILTSAVDVWLSYRNIYSNYTVSKVFATMLLLGSLKHFDVSIQQNQNLNSLLDILAKYSFGLFFVHWYWLFVFNQFVPALEIDLNSVGNYMLTIAYVATRFVIVTFFSFMSLMFVKFCVEKLKIKLSSRNVVGV